MSDLITKLLGTLWSKITKHLSTRDTIIVLVLAIFTVGLFFILHNEIPVIQLIWPALIGLMAVGYILVRKIKRWWMGSVVVVLFFGWAFSCYLAYTNEYRTVMRLMATATKMKQDKNYSGGLATYEEAYSLAKAHKLPKEEMDCLHEMGEIEFLMSEYSDARSKFEECRKVAEEINDQKMLGYVWFRLGDIERFSGNTDLALRHFKRSMEIYLQTTDKDGQAGVYRGLADVELKRNASKARQNYNESLKLYQEAKDTLGEADALAGLGDLEGRVGNSTQARDYYNRALELYQQDEGQDGEDGQGDVYRGLGDLELFLGNLEQADGAYHQAFGFYQSAKDSGGMADVFRGWGDLARVKVNEDRINEEYARQRYQQALDIYNQIKEQNGAARVFNKIGELVSGFNANLASENYKNALRIYTEIQSVDGQAGTYKDIGDLDIKGDHSDDAQRHYDKALDLYKKVENQLGQAEVHKGLGDLARKLDQLDVAQQHYNQALQFYQDMQYQSGIAQIQLVSGDLLNIASAKEPPLKKTKKINEARASFSKALEAYETSDNKLGQAVALQGIANVEAKQNNSAAAQRHLNEAAKLYNTMGISSNIVTAQNTIDPNHPVRKERIARLTASF
jgi:tetratricopeptide (TPR) repeat protein